MSILDTTLKEILGTRYAKYALVLIAGGILALSVPKYLVTVPVFAQAMKQVYQQMQNGDMIQERQWLESQNAHMKREKMDIYRSSRNLSEVEKQMIKDLDSEITCNQKRINDIDDKLKNQWGK